MMRGVYAKRDVIRHYFTLPNQIFDLGLHYIEVVIYAYLLRIENRKTFRCVIPQNRSHTMAVISNAKQYTVSQSQLSLLVSQKVS